MLYDVRTYTCRPGTIKKQLAIYEELGYAVQKKHLGEPVAYMQTETGNVNSFMHIWLYADAADRSQRRAELMKDAAWHNYLQKSVEAGYLISQENQLMVPTSFFKP